MASRHGHEIDTTRRLNVFKTLSRPLDTSINHTTLGFPPEIQESLTRQAEGTPRSTGIYPSLRCRL